MPTSDPQLTDRIKAANVIARQHFGVFQWPTLVLMTVLVAVQVALIGAGLTGQFPLALAVALVALLQYPSYICYHEAAHGNIAGGRVTVVNETAGSLLGVVLGVPLIAHRKEHLAHHAYTNRDGADPDRIAFARGRFEAGSSVRLLGQQYRFFVSRSWAAATRGERLRFALETGIILALRAALIAAFGWQGLVVVATVPLVGVALIGYLVVYLVHAVPAPLPEGRWVDTISYETDHLPRAVRRLVEWGWMGHHVHGIHHLYPKVPFYRQQEVFDEIRGLMADLGAPVRRLWAPSGLREATTLAPPTATPLARRGWAREATSAARNHDDRQQSNERRNGTHESAEPASALDR